MTSALFLSTDTLVKPQRGYAAHRQQPTTHRPINTTFTFNRYKKTAATPKGTGVAHKAECAHARTFEARGRATLGIFEYIECLYSRARMARRAVVLRHPPAGFGQVARLLFREEAGEDGTCSDQEIFFVFNQRVHRLQRGCRVQASPSPSKAIFVCRIAYTGNCHISSPL